MPAGVQPRRLFFVCDWHETNKVKRDADGFDGKLTQQVHERRSTDGRNRVEYGPHRYGEPIVVTFTTVTSNGFSKQERGIAMGLVLLIILVLLIVGALPTWNHSRNWGYAPTGGFGLVLVVILILVLMGKI